MPLKSEFFRGDPRLEACLVSDPAHITPDSSGDHVAKIQAALITLDQADIDEAELKAAKYGPSTRDAVVDFKSDPRRNIINRAYEDKVDPIVGKMTIARMDQELLDRTLADQDGDFIAMTDQEIAQVKADLNRSKQMLDLALSRLHAAAHVAADGSLLVTPANFKYYDTKMKVFNAFRINAFTADDNPAPPDILAKLRLAYPGMTDIPKGSDPPTDGILFLQLLINFDRLRASMNERFLKWHYRSSTFNGGPLSLFSAFVDAKHPDNTTVHFTRFYFDTSFPLTQDSRAVTVAHERAHTIFRINGHPGTGDNPFCVAPHLGDPNVQTSTQALANAYCYEWLIDSLQPDYNSAEFRGVECGTH